MELISSFASSIKGLFSKKVLIVSIASKSILYWFEGYLTRLSSSAVGINIFNAFFFTMPVTINCPGLGNAFKVRSQSSIFSTYCNISLITSCNLFRPVVILRLISSSAGKIFLNISILSILFSLLSEMFSAMKFWDI